MRINGMDIYLLAIWEQAAHKIKLGVVPEYGRLLTLTFDRQYRPHCEKVRTMLKIWSEINVYGQDTREDRDIYRIGPGAFEKLASSD
jgi:hypothetical protein